MTVPVTLTHYAQNPILVPSMHNAWETDTVFDAAVIKHDGLVYMHINYRNLVGYGFWGAHHHRAWG